MWTALVVDIDGVVCPASGASPFGALVEVGVALQPVRVPPSLCDALTDLAGLPRVTPVWLTSWLPETRQAMRPPFPGREWEQLDLSHGAGDDPLDLSCGAGDDRRGPSRGAGADSRDPWPKWAALRAWLGRHPEVTRVAWIDDDLAHGIRPEADDTRPGPAGGTSAQSRVQHYTTELGHRGLDVLLLAPAADGLTPRHLARLTDWITRDRDPRSGRTTG